MVPLKTSLSGAQGTEGALEFELCFQPQKALSKMVELSISRQGEMMHGPRWKFQIRLEAELEDPSEDVESSLANGVATLDVADTAAVAPRASIVRRDSRGGNVGGGSGSRPGSGRLRAQGSSGSSSRPGSRGMSAREEVSLMELAH